MSFFKDKPVRNKAYLKWIKTLPCCACGLPDHSDPHHIIGAGEGGMGTKACDLLVMPLCRRCHTDMHQNLVLHDEQWRFVAKTLQRAIKDGVISGEM